MCLELLKDPVTTACGHNYCMNCINTYWSKDHERHVEYSCPLCRQTFNPRPVLKKNTLLAETVEKLRNKGYQDIPPDSSYAEAGDVECDICSGKKRKAVKSCLVCLVSYCEPHLQPHFDVPPLKKHKMINASVKLEMKICPRHDKLLEIYCRTDQQCICLQCVMEEHKGHDAVSAAEERTEKQRQLQKTQQEVQLRAQEIGTEIYKLGQAKDFITSSVWTAVDDFDRACDEHIRVYNHLIESKRLEVKEQIRLQQGAAVRQAETLTKSLTKEAAKLKDQDTEMELLSQTEDPIHFLRSFQSLGDLPGPKATSTTSGTVMKCISEQRKKIESMGKEEIRNMATSLPLQNYIVIKAPHLCPTLKLKNRRDISTSCFSKVVVDPNTVCMCLHLFDENRTISWGDEAQAHPDHPDRFSYYQQALSKQGLSGTCYWEVEWSGGIVDVAVSYRGISRKGWSNNCRFGHNDQSWRLDCSSSGWSFWHDKMFKPISIPCYSRVGVYLDHSRGILAFYSVSDCGTMSLLHRVHTIFTEPLYPGFSVDLGATLKIRKLRVERSRR